MYHGGFDKEKYKTICILKRFSAIFYGLKKHFLFENKILKIKIDSIVHKLPTFMAV